MTTARLFFSHSVLVAGYLPTEQGRGHLRAQHEGRPDVDRSGDYSPL